MSEQASDSHVDEVISFFEPSESPVAAACRRVRDLEDTGGYGRVPRDLERLTPTLRDLLCGEGGALELLEGMQSKLRGVEWSCVECGHNPPKHASYCALAALLRRAAEELGATEEGGGS